QYILASAPHVARYRNSPSLPAPRLADRHVAFRRTGTWLHLDSASPHSTTVGRTGRCHPGKIQKLNESSATVHPVDCGAPILKLPVHGISLHLAYLTGWRTVRLSVRH